MASIKKNQIFVPEGEASVKRGAFLHTKNIIIGLMLLLILSVTVSVYFYQEATTNPQKEAEKELQETIEAVGKLMVLPVDETPTLATVSDPEKLRDQSFFANAKKGDRVLIYSSSRKAILYSPSLNKIIEVSPLNINQ